AMALFGEKYGEQVRVIVFDQEHSVELCGGTHVGNTRDIRLFKLVSESSIAAGVRRVEAYTGSKAFEYLNEKQETLSRVSAILKDPKDIEKSVGDLVEKNKELEKALQKLNAEKVGQLKQGLLDKAESISGINIIRAKVDLGSSDDLKQLSFDLKRATENTLVVLGAVIKDKPQLSVIISDDLAEKGTYHAGNMVRELAKEIKGGGGGQPFFATAGGKDVNGIQAALEKVTQML
ncbi:MAG: DHHA1 domain-containing protein, partial [Bacteroidota bacterium]